MSTTQQILWLVEDERVRQTRLFIGGKLGFFDCACTAIPDSHKLPVLVEEVGEVARAMNDNEPKENLKAELIQVAAVAVAWAESL